MYNVSSNYKTGIYANSRMNKGRVTFGVTDITASSDISGITVTSESALSLKSQLSDNARSSSFKFATNEVDRFKLDGSWTFADQNLASNGEIGWASDLICDSAKVFATPQVVTFSFNNNHSSIGLTVTFDPLNGEYATDFTITAYDANNAVIATYPFTGNTLSQVLASGQLTNYRKVAVQITKWSVPNRRARVSEVDFGLVQVYTGDTGLIDMELIEEADITSATLPSPEFRFTVDNTDRKFNILNPTGFYKSLQQRQQVIGEIGLVNADGSTEWVQLGNYLLWEWQSDEGSLTSTFFSRTNLDVMASYNYQNLVTVPNYSLYELALDVLKTSGLDGAAQRVAYTQDWSTNPFTVGATTVNSANGTLNVTSTSGDPMINMFSLGSFDPNVYRYMQVKYRVISGNPANFELFFTNTTYTGANGSAMLASDPYINDGSWHIAYLDMWNHSGWKTGGNITGWRFDWAVTSGVQMEFDYVRLVDRKLGNDTVYYVDPQLQTLPTSGLVRNTNCKNLLQMIANAGRASAYVNRTGQIRLVSSAPKIRYIRDWVAGSNVNTGNHWVEIQAIDANGNNQALNKTVTAMAGATIVVSQFTQPATALVNGDTATGNYVGLSPEDSVPRYLQVDMGSLYDISTVKVWHYYGDARTYYSTKTEVSADGTNWFTIFDSAIEGTYAETSSGRTSQVALGQPSQTVVDTITLGNQYEEPRINLDKIVKQVNVSYYTDLNTAVSVSAIAPASIKSGDILELSGNTLISTSAQAANVANWILGKKLNNRSIYSLNWRGNQALELLDPIAIGNSFGSNTNANITRMDLKYKGYVEATTELRGVTN